MESAKGKVRLLRPSDLAETWAVATDPNRTVWEVVHQLIRLAETASDKDCPRVFATLPPGSERDESE